jgi:hypothetical protein
VLATDYKVQAAAKLSTFVPSSGHLALRQVKKSRFQAE